MLKENWITENHIDFEYKKYLLLHYLQKIDKRFTETRLYPYLPELIERHQQLENLRIEKQTIKDSFSKELEGIEINKLRLIYRQIVKDNPLMEEIDSIIDYSLPKLDYYIKEGESICELVKEKLQIFPIGVVPLYTDEGYLFLQTTNKRLEVFQYSLILNPKKDEKPRTVKTTHILSNKTSFSSSFENMKDKLIRTRPELPNPATYVVESELELPIKETLLPLAKRILIKYVSSTT